jgi:hypothetical protein
VTTGSLGRAFASTFGALTLVVAAGCTQQAQTVTLRSLEASGTFSFVCLGAENGARNIDDCPDFSQTDGEYRHLITLVTQATRGEVALVDLTTGDVIDDEPTIPGFNFLPVGAEPRAIVSTPGSQATFVGVKEVGKEGIYALPSSCLAPRRQGERMRDLTMWPACSLPSEPGDMVVLIDHPVDGDRDPATPPAPQCEPMFPVATSEEIESRECPADLSLETLLPGRRFLAVTLPDRGELAIIDAQALLDRPPGSFEPCPIQSITKLQVNLPAEPPQQVLPPDLDLPGATRPVGFPGETLDGNQPRPGGLALVDDRLTGEERLFVSDRGAPVIHVLDAKNPCALAEKEPLLPMSYTNPSAAVTTKRLAASPLTSQQKRYLYAVEDSNPGGRLMFFDISLGATDRTPLLRPRSALMPLEDPDRITFGAPVNDVTFARPDRIKADAITGSGPVGVFCDPDPAKDPNLGPAKFRPSPELGEGARPSLLRGVFGFAALSSGSVGIIDVEDFDAPCRRPASVNTASTPDFRGCSNDPDVGEYVRDNRATVSQEISCNAVEPHRLRSAFYVLNDTDVSNGRAPSLQAFPRLLTEAGRTLPSDNSDEGRKSPKMLGVNFGKKPEERAQVYVGATLYDRDSPENRLEIDPAKAEQHSLVLDMTEPRTSPPSEGFTATYEGSLFPERNAGRFVSVDGKTSMVDADGRFSLCDAGGEDEEIAAIRGRSLGVAEGDLRTFQDHHTDYLRITSDLPAESDAYWTRGGSTCGGVEAGSGFLNCKTRFGTRKAMRAEREFTIKQISAGELILEPRSGNQDLGPLAYCCFPELVSYEVRASNTWVVQASPLRAGGYRHDLRTNPATQRCEITTDPLRSQQRGRVYEVSCARDSLDCATPPTGPDADFTPMNIGLAEPATDVACVVQNPTAIQTLGDSPCIFQGLVSRFVIYRGQTPSVRDWTFSWGVSGGFVPLAIPLATSSDPNSNPQTIVYSRPLGGLVIADGASKGLITVDLGTFQSSFFF